MQSTASEFLMNEMKETAMANPRAKMVCFEARDLRDSIPVTPDASQTEQYDLICVDNLVEKLRISEKARELMAALFSGLGPGGRLLVGRKPEGLTEGTLDEDLEDMTWLSSHIPEEEISGQAVFRDQTGENIFFEIYKRAA
jgi:hypothetical protein